MDWHELQKHKVADLRELMKEHLPEVTGITQMKKNELVELLAEKLGIERPHKVVTGLDKTSIKARLRDLKAKRQAALEAGDKTDLHRRRRQIHILKRKLRKAASLTH
ncbi:hypothetical protein KKG45_11470 [bacterium]|nr:hypothetical protein [bacterium]MBU1073854.1 hypothetical protein [bacterium]MBU1675754.1 hypothetical protein [bacterium]